MSRFLVRMLPVLLPLALALALSGGDKHLQRVPQTTGKAEVVDYSSRGCSHVASLDARRLLLGMHAFPVYLRDY